MQNAKALVEQARITNRERSEIDRAGGHTPPERTSLVELVRTAKMAIFAGIATEGWAAVAEGYAMLEIVEEAVKIK